MGSEDDADEPRPGAEARASRPSDALVGVSWYAATRDAYDDPESYVRRARRVGFELVTLVPTYTYAGLDDIEFSHVPSFDAQRKAMIAILRSGMQLVVKPHLDPPIYEPGFDLFTSDNRSWRAACPWRGYFDVDPLSPDYFEKLLLPTLDAVERALREVGRTADDDPGPPGTVRVRLDLGSELMNSTVHQAGRWRELLSRIRKQLARRDLEERVDLSHNFSHHFLIEQDFVLRMDEAQRNALREYIAGLDALAISQYMDLTIAVAAERRDDRLPTPGEVADALVQHERTLRERILTDLLGLEPSRVPALHVGEFGIGQGGLARPSLWENQPPDEIGNTLPEQIAIGHRGFFEYLKGDERTVHSGVLWVTGIPYDIFGWQDAEASVPEAAAVYREGLDGG